MFQIKLVLLAVIAISVVANTYAKHMKIEPRIVNGLTAERGQFPFYVFLEVHSSLWIVIFKLFFSRKQNFQHKEVPFKF